MIRAITIAREYGSGGAVVARLLADRLGWRLLDRDLLNEVARAANVAPTVAERYDERIDPWFHRLVKHALWRGAARRTRPSTSRASTCSMPRRWRWWDGRSSKRRGAWATAWW